MAGGKAPFLVSYSTEYYARSVQYREQLYSIQNVYRERPRPPRHDNHTPAGSRGTRNEAGAHVRTDQHRENPAHTHTHRHKQGPIQKIYGLNQQHCANFLRGKPPQKRDFCGHFEHSCESLDLASGRRARAAWPLWSRLFLPGSRRGPSPRPSRQSARLRCVSTVCLHLCRFGLFGGVWPLFCETRH